MRAAIIEKHGSIEVREMSEPQVGDYDAFCDLLYGSICTGTDSHIVAGNFPYLSPLPTVLGHESVGRVVQIGSKVKNYQIGDLVTRVGTPPSPADGISITWGGFAQRGIAKDHWAMCEDGLPEASWQGYRVNQIIPAAVDPKVSPMFITWRETLSYLLRRGFVAGRSLLVIGSGGNGLSFAAHAKNLGASCVAMAGSARLEAPAKAKAGVSVYFDYKRADLTAALNEAQPGGFDFILDAVGQKGVADQVLPCLKSGGHYAIYGIDDFQQVLLNPALVRGPFTVHGSGDYDEAETHQQVSEFVLQGKLDASLWYDVGHPYPLTQINDAFAAVKGRRTVKAVIDLQG